MFPRTINMRQRFLKAVAVLAFLSIATVDLALPSQQQMTDKLHRDHAKKGKPTPTPLPQSNYSRTTAPSRTTTTTGRSSSSPAAQSSTSSGSRASSTSGSRPSTVVVIDAGHGGHDRGGIPGQRVSEKMMTLDVAQRLRSILAADGYRTVMTRNSDVFVPLGTRVAIANSYSNSIFVCIHFNSASRRGANGIETYFYNSQSLGLASAIHYYVSRAAPSLNRGVRRRGYFVLRRTRVPSVLVECGFLTNPSEAQYAQSASYRQTLAEQIARGVRSRTLVASTDRVPLQPYIDQTRVRDRGGSRHRSRKSSRKKSSGKKSSQSSGTKKKKKSVTKQSEG